MTEQEISLLLKELNEKQLGTIDFINKKQGRKSKFSKNEGNMPFLPPLRPPPTPPPAPKPSLASDAQSSSRENVTCSYVCTV